jgi:hypothetical protein
MGTYTEIYVKVVLKEYVDDNVINILKYMLGIDDVESEDLEIPPHSLFATERWHYMLRSGSHYHIPYKVKLFECHDIGNNYYLVVRSDFKNYDGEIEKFFDWITPYIEKDGDKTFIGYSLYEEDDEPKLYYVEGYDL